MLSFGYNMRFSIGRSDCRGGALPFCLIMAAVFATVLLADLELLRHARRILVQTHGYLYFENDVANTVRTLRRAYLNTDGRTDTPRPFNATCFEGYCFFGHYKKVQGNTTDCDYRAPPVPVLEDEALWRNANTHRRYRQGDYHYRVVTEFLCFTRLVDRSVPLYRTSVRAQWREEDSMRAQRQVQVVHTATREYSWQEFDAHHTQ